MATGEIGRKPKIIVWDSDTLQTLAVLKGFHKRGVPLLAFSEGRGDRLASVGLGKGVAGYYYLYTAAV